MNEATLLTSDLDFKPLIDTLVQEGMNVSLWYQKNRTNYELVDADIRQPLSISRVSSWFTNDFRRQAKLPESIQLNNKLHSDWIDLNQNEENSHYSLCFVP